MELTPDQWQAIFTGSITQDSDGKPKQACLYVEQPPRTPPGVSFDIDSILGFVDSPAVATHGIWFYSALQYGQNISTDVPHFIFARAEGADFITFHLFFHICHVPMTSIGLQQLWDHVLAAVCQPGLQDFRDPELFIQAKGTKLLFKYPDAPSDLLAVMNSFDDKLHGILDFSHICSDRLYIDVGKETCPIPNGVPSPEPWIYLWRRCCIRHHLSQLYDGSIPKSGQNFYHESMLRDAGGMTTLTPVRSRLRRGGILYGQMYSLTKQIVDAARTYPFQNPDLRLLALDPQLRNGMQSIGGKPASGKNITDRAYLASKRRCHYGLTDSKQRSFGVREEYRISWVLFQSILAVLRSLTPKARFTYLPGPPPYLWTVRTPIFVDYVWRNINKFITGFELVRAQCSGGLTTWEQTKLMDMFLRCLRVAVGGYDYSREGALWWSRRELPQPVGLPRVYYGLGFGQTLEHLSRRADLSLEWLRQYPRDNVITDQIVSWLCHICLQQMRADVLHSIQGDLRPKVRTTILDDHVQFYRKGLSATLVNGMTAVSGNRASVKSPQEVAQALFGLNDGWLRGHWENKPFRKLHQWMCTALQHMSTENRLLQVFNCRLQRYLFAHHWVLPYPTPGGLAPRTKDGKRRWFSIDVQCEAGLAKENASLESWYWAGTRWRPGYPTPLPRYLRWSQDEWQSWVHRHIGQTLSYEVRELSYDQENFAFNLSDKHSGLRRNPLRGIRDPVVRDLRKSRDGNSLILNAPGIESEAHVLAMPQQAIPSHLQPELEFQMCEQVERYIASLRKQIADGCEQVFKSQKSPIPQSTRRHIISCHAPQEAMQPRLAPRPQQAGQPRLAPIPQQGEQPRLAPMPLLPEQVAPVLGSQLTPLCLPRPTVRLYYVARGSQRPPRNKENRRQTVSKRGRPAKYANREEKAAADVARSRDRRRAQSQMELDRQAENPFRFYQFTQ
ncbi:hypothetical protein FSARC_12483 [Fusarium sarcochroum]|uniref:Uncharacterized protein n=1 Tax=Fusarium sarcochroum TaxID=1208366 RepID=A0A8H4T8G9_9HYPO|nr:hypothetical protein FSARC_12483 [Fusarium sarcochroum]